MEVLGHIVYEKYEQIGVDQGRMSKVYRALDKHLGGECAIKEISKQRLRDQQLSDYFIEAKTMFASGHPKNVVPIRYACDVPNADMIAICMPLYTNGSLLDRIKDGPLPFSELQRVAHGSLNGLQKIHNAGYFHFDIKPSNILLDGNHEPLVADFGQTRRFDADGTVSFPAMYPNGLPPEFYAGDVGTIFTDIFHFGLLLYRLANGEPFFREYFPKDGLEREEQTLAGKFPNTDKFMPHVSKGLRTIIRTCVSVSPKDRYRSAADLDYALANVSPANDWEVIAQPDGAITWISQRPGRCNLEVDLSPAGNKWAVDVFNKSDKRRRRQGFTGLTGLTKQQATEELKKVFAKLEQAARSH